MVYGHVMIRKPFGALPAVDEEDIQWMREHRIKAFGAVTTGNYGDKGRVGAGRIGVGGWGRGRYKSQIEALSLLHWTSFILSCPALYLPKKSSHCEAICNTSLFIVFFGLRTKLIPIFFMFFPTVAPCLRAGVQSIMHLAGLGKMRPNTVVMGFKRNWTDQKNIHDVHDYLGVINDTFELNYGLVILRMDGKQKREIIVQLEGNDIENSNSILDEDKCSKSKPHSSPATKSTKEDRKSLTSPDKHSPEISEDRIKSPLVETSLKEKKRGTIDVWWIYDDGGLTVLIPYLLSLHHAWKHCKLRFFSADIRSKHELSPQRLRMANLLKKFRIDASCVEQTEDISKKPSKESIDAFRRLPVGQELGDAPIEDQKVLRTIRIGELVRQNCTSDTRLVVISIPVPVDDVTTPFMYMSWLEVLSADLPPTLLVRGNQTNVLTFYS